jgi:hypothetical protein
VANGTHRRKNFFQLEQEEGTIVGQENLRNYISEYYKALFEDLNPSNVSMVESFNHDIPQLSQEENEILVKDFSEKEVFDAIMQMKKNKAPGPDGFPAEFYQTFWGVVKEDLMQMFSSFQDGNLPLFHLNYGTVILLPKKENTIKIQQYRPICLLNVSFKIFTKVGTNRIVQIAETVIRPTQTAFMPGRHILEGVVILHNPSMDRFDLLDRTGPSVEQGPRFRTGSSVAKPSRPQSRKVVISARNLAISSLGQAQSLAQ